MIRLCLAAAALAATTPLAAQEVTLSPSQALEGYYSALQQQIELPVAPAGKALDLSTALTRIGVGSCNSERRSQHMWAEILKTDPQLFLLIGDNVYGDQQWNVAFHVLRALLLMRERCCEGSPPGFQRSRGWSWRRAWRR